MHVMNDEMNDADLIKARVLTQELVSRTLKELTIAFVLIIVVVTSVTFLFPSILDITVSFATFIFGFVIGSVVGAVRAYNIFWERLKTTYQRDIEKEKETKQ